MDCIFCRIVKGELPSKKVYESDLVVAIEDIHKVAPVHVLIVPKEHFSSIMALPPQETALLADIQQAIRSVADASGIAESGFRVVTNHGEPAGQTVFHLHFHVIGGRVLQTSLG